MSMTRSEFNMAFSTVIAEEFANIPDESEIEVEFSDEFNRKMQELIDSIGANNGQEPKNDRKSRLNIKGLIACGDLGAPACGAGERQCHRESDSEFHCQDL